MHRAIVVMKKKPAPAQPRPAARRIFIVDDHPMMRDGLRQLIGNEPGLEVCGEADDAPAALQQICSLKPDLAIVDISLRSSSGLELIKSLADAGAACPVLVLSMHDESLYAERVLRAGGRGYIMKQEGGRKIMEAVRRVLEGRAYVSDKLAATIIDIFSGHRSDSSSAVEKLSDREFEILQHIGHGLATKDIAQRVRISVKTVEVHRVNIKRKLGLRTATELIHFAVRWVESQPTI
jgi:DNA-binding NarL/FixJ family response regulator